MIYYYIKLTFFVAVLAWAGFASDMTNIAYSQEGDHPRTSDRQRDSERVESYLRTLNLDLLFVEHLEIETARTVDPSIRRRRAQRLANLYAQRMISNQNASSADWQARSQKLLITYPGLSTPLIRLATLQSRFLDAEKSLSQWWESGAPSDRTSELIVQWKTIRFDLQSLNHFYETEYQHQLAQSEFPSNDPIGLNRDLIATEARRLHTEYLLGWTCYSLAWVAPNSMQQTPDAAANWVFEADRHFREFLQIEPEKLLTELAPSWIDFSSDWNVRALAGLAMCQRSLKRIEQSEHCFKLIGRHARNQTIIDLRLIWDLKCRLLARDFQAIAPLIDAADGAALSEAGRVKFWRAALRAGIATQSTAKTTSRLLIRNGLSGLAREFQAPWIQQFLTENNLTAEFDDFLNHWLAGYLAFHDIQSSQEKQSFEIPINHLRRAIALKNQTDNPLDVACCRFLLAQIDFQLNSYEKAADGFVDASLAFEKSAPRLAAESQWMAVRSFAQLTKHQPRSAFHAHRAIDNLLHRFPGSAFANRAKFEKLRIELDRVPPPKAIKRFRVLSPDNPNYAAAQFEILRIRYKQWNDSYLANDDDESARMDAVIHAQQSIQNAPQAGVVIKAKSGFLVVDAMLKQESPDFDSIRGRLISTETLLRPLDETDSIFREYHYYIFMLASQSGDDVAAQREAEWLSDNARGSRFEKSAILRLAQLADSQVQSASRPSLESVREAIGVFERLSELLGTTDETLKSASNARIAFARLAELKHLAGQFEDATPMFVTLNRVFPDHQTYLHLLAKSYTLANKFDQAITLWRKLSGGSKPGSSIWMESKHQLAVCLFHLGNRKAATDVYEQTMLLSPELPLPWREQFDTLSELLQSEQRP